MESVYDRLNRPLHDLRISVVDRCNFRCTYCMPREIYGSDYAFLPEKHLLSFDEITRIARAAVSLGVNKIRLTGGEPLMRRKLDELVAKLAAIDGLDDLALTTNGILLARQAQALQRAGLKRVTVSLDSLDTTNFQRISDTRSKPQQVLEGIHAAQQAGLGPVKVNMVVKRGMNDADIVPMADYFRHSGCTLRFIEFMDVGNSNAWQRPQVVTAAEIRDRLAARWPLEPVDPDYPGEVARRYRYTDGGGEVGFITSVSQPFCGDCSRLRLAADGKTYTCLFAQKGFDLRRLLREGIDDIELADRLRRLWMLRDDRYSEQRVEQRSKSGGVPKIEMPYIGG